MQYKRLFLRIALMLLTGSCFFLRGYTQARPQVFFKVTLLPPYSAYLSDYSNNYLVTMINQGSAAIDIFLQVKISNDLGGYAQTRDNVYSLPIHLQPRQTVSLMGNQVDPSLFAPGKLDNHFDMRKIGNINRDAQLPEGVYTFCMTPFYYEAGRQAYFPLPINPPGSNCLNFVISTAKPPILTTPVNEQTVFPNAASAINVSWTRPTGVTARANISYTLYLVKVNPGEDPNQTMTNVADYGAGYFYKVTDLQQPIYSLNNTLPYKLEAGSRYAVMVQATDNTHTLAIENNGRSVVNTFVYGSPGNADAATNNANAATPQSGVITGSTGPAVKTVPFIPPSEGPDAASSFLTGNIKYYFDPDNFAPGKAFSLSHVPVKLIKEYFVYIPQAGGISMSLTSNSLSVYPTDGFDDTTVDFNFLNTHQVEELGNTTTDAQGNFQFAFPYAKRTNEYYGNVNVTGLPDFVNDKTLGKYIPKFAHTVTVYDPNTGKTTGVNVPSNNSSTVALFSMMTLQVLNKYYYGPLVQVPAPGYNPNDSNYSVYFEDTLSKKDLGSLNAYVADFNFHVHLNLDVQSGGYDKPADHSKFNVFVLRKKGPDFLSNSVAQFGGGAPEAYSDALPPGETQTRYDPVNKPVIIPDIIKKSPYEVVGFATTDASGYCDFTRLRCFSGDPSYYFYAAGDPENDLDYAMQGILGLQDLINMGAINFASNDPTRQLTLTLEPGPGLLWGNVRRNDSKYAVKDAQVTLSINSAINNQVNTDAQGYYQMIPGVSGTNTFLLDAGKAGFLHDEVSFTGSLKTGQKIHTDLFIDTSATISGKIVDENGDGVDAYVSIQNGSSVKTQSGSYYTDAQGRDHYTPATFSIGCPKGGQTLLIDPTDNHFETQSVSLTINQSLIDEGTIVLKRKKRAVKFIVLESKGIMNAAIPQGGGDGDGGYKPPVNKPIPNAMISIDVNGFKGVTDQNGEADLDLENSNALDLSVKVAGPAAFNYISSTTTVHIQAGGNGQTVYLYMKPGCQVQGFVNAKGKQIPGATVIFKNGPPSGWLTTTTDANGYYELHGVPAGNGLVFDAGKQGYAGDEEKGNPSVSKHFTVDFALTTNGNIDFTQMLGFKMIVTKYDTAGKLLSGYFHQLPDNGDFKVLQDTLIPFSNIKVKTYYASKGDYDVFYPEQMPLRTDLNNMELGAKGYGVRIRLNDPQNGVLITGKNNIGAVSALSKVDIGAIQDATDLVFTDDLYLRSSVAVKVPDAIQTITADGKAPYGNDLPLSNASGKDIHFTYQGFSLTGSPLGSVINGDQVCRLAGTLSAQLVTDENMQQTVAIPISRFEFSDHNGVSNMVQSGTFQLPIQQWKMVGDQYTFGPDGFHIDKGHVQTTQVNVPFTGMVMKHNPMTGKEELKYGSYQLQNLDLAGVATLALAPAAVPQFFYDPGQQLWQLIVAGPSNTKIGTIQGLTPLNKELSVSEFALNSKDKNGHIQLTADSKSVSIYNGLANYTIGYIDVSPDTYTLNLSDGVLDPGIPQLVSYGQNNLPSSNNTLSFRKQNGQVVVDVLPFTLRGKASGVDLSFPIPTNFLQPGAVKVAGVLSESGSNPYQLHVLLNHTVNSSVISIDPNGDKILFIDQAKKRSINNLSGSMQTNAGNTAWSPFKFEGDLSGCVNVNGHLHFTINGDIGIDPGQKLAVASINNGGNAVNQMAFDFTKGEMRGKVSIPNEDLGGGISFGGSATMVVNQSGWFFAGNGNAGFPNPIISSAGVALLMGNYPNAGSDPDIAAAFSQSYFFQKNHGLPPNYQQLNGFLIDAQIAKDIIPPTSVSWGTGDLDISCLAFGDLYLGAKLADPKTLDIGGMVGAKASLSASQSLGIVCINGAAGADIDGYFTGAFDASGRYCLSAGGDFGVYGSLEIKAGGCSGSCNDLLGLTPCVDIVPKLGVGVQLSMSYTLGNQPGCKTGIQASLK